MIIEKKLIKEYKNIIYMGYIKIKNYYIKLAKVI